jgi:hypothetical protein
MELGRGACLERTPDLRPAARRSSISIVSVGWRLSFDKRFPRAELGARPRRSAVGCHCQLSDAGQHSSANVCMPGSPTPWMGPGIA